MDLRYINVARGKPKATNARHHFASCLRNIRKETVQFAPIQTAILVRLVHMAGSRANPRSLGDGQLTQADGESISQGNSCISQVMRLMASTAWLLAASK